MSSDSVRIHIVPHEPRLIKEIQVGPHSWVTPLTFNQEGLYWGEIQMADWREIHSWCRQLGAFTGTPGLTSS